MRSLAFFVLIALIAACSGSAQTFQSSSSREDSPATQIVAADSADLNADSTDLTASLPIDPAVRVDTLANGLRYYVRRNTEPEDRAELYLAVDAGSVLESDEQLGLAHFVEHMLFNGTRRFPNEELIAFLESTGMRFGPDVNAYTSFDETVYTLTIPTDSISIVEGAFDVLFDWAMHATLSDSMIDLERGVVLEEWRMSNQNASGRVRDELILVILQGSRYAERLPIGKPEIIQHAPYETIRDFYERWYRPDLMAVIAVGDFDVDEIEERIRETFAALPAADDSEPRPTFDVPGHEATLYKVITDPEYPYASVQIYYKEDAEQIANVGDYRERLVESLIQGMLNARLDEIARRGDAPFLGASVYEGSFVRPATYHGAFAQVHEDSVLTGLSSVLTEAARVRRHGFTSSELDRQKQEILRAYQKAFEERETTNSAALAREYVSHFLEDEPIPGIEIEYELVQQLLPTVTIAEVNEHAPDLLTGDNRAVVVIMPEKEGVTPPTEAQLREVLERVERSTIEPYVDEVRTTPLVAQIPEPASIVDERQIEAIGVREISLANGVRVVMKQTDFKEDEVRMTAFSPGGSSLVSDAEAFEAEISPQVVARSGVGSFSRTELEKYLAGKVVSVSPYINELEEGFGGSSSPQDLETLLQLVYLYITEPRAEPDALQSIQNQLRSSLINRSSNPIAVWQDSLQAALYGNDPRRRTPTVEMVDSLRLDESLRYYRDRFADASDFTFVFVGSFDPDSLEHLARRYLGALPARDRDETWRDVAPEKPDNVVETTVTQGIGEQSAVALVFHGPMEFNREQRHRLRSLADVLSILLRRDLREGRGGVYNVGVNAGTAGRPDGSYTFTISFGCAPERVEELQGAVFDQIERIKEHGPPDDVVATVREQQRRQRETDLRTNGFWTSVLEFYYSYSEDPLEVLSYSEMIDAIAADEIRETARAYLDTDRYVAAVLYPEAEEAPAGTSE